MYYLLDKTRLLQPASSSAGSVCTVPGGGEERLIKLCGIGWNSISNIGITYDHNRPKRNLSQVEEQLRKEQ